MTIMILFVGMTGLIGLITFSSLSSLSYLSSLSLYHLTHLYREIQHKVAEVTPEEKRQKKSRAWLLDPEQASELLGVSRSSVVRMINDGVLPAVCLKSGKRKKVWRIRREVLEKWVLSKERIATTPAQIAPEASTLKPVNGRGAGLIG